MPLPAACLDPETPSSRRAPLNAILAACAVLLAAACGEGSDLLLLPGDGQPVSIRAENDGQSGRVGEPLADSVSFMVSDSRLRPVEGARIVFDLSSVPGADVVPDTTETNADGRAAIRVVLGTTIGAQVGQARVVMPDGSPGPTTNFTSTALSENANGITALSGDDQTAPAGTALSQPLVVQVSDAFGNPIAGVPINWAAEGGGSVSVASNQTDADGRASVQRTLGPTAGIQTTVATSEGLAGSPVTFTHNATAGSAAGLSVVSGDGQTAQAGSTLPGDLVVRLVDAGGNGVPGAAVTWVVGTGGGGVSPENTVTDEAGRSSSRWTLGPNPGENRVDAVVSGVGVVHFTAIGTAARPAGLVIVTQPSGSATNGQALERQPVIQVRDGAGNPQPGVVVTAQLAGGGGELLGTRQLGSDANGRVAYTDLAIAGAEGPRRLVFTAGGFGGATSDVIVVQHCSDQHRHHQRLARSVGGRRSGDGYGPGYGCGGGTARDGDGDRWRGELRRNAGGRDGRLPAAALDRREQNPAGDVCRVGGTHRELRYRIAPGGCAAAPAPGISLRLRRSARPATSSPAASIRMEAATATGRSGATAGTSETAAAQISGVRTIRMVPQIPTM